MMDFPKGFLWGAATSAFQYEGAATEDGKGATTADVRAAGIGGDGPGIAQAADGYHRWREDVALMAELGLTSYRFSISWARVYPHGDDAEPNEAGLAYYRALLEALRDAGIEPVVTLLHFDVPYDLVRRYEGFVSRECVDAFARYCETCFREFGGLVRHWITINEQNVMAALPSMLGLSPDDADLALKQAKANYHMFLASARAVEACHRMLPDALIGPDVSYPTNLPATGKTTDVLAAFDLEELMAYEPMEVYARGTVAPKLAAAWEKVGLSVPEDPEDERTLAAGTCDFMGVNWYCTTMVSAGEAGGAFNIGSVKVARNPDLEYTEWGWSYDPTALRMALQECWARFRKPIMVCENGWSEREEPTSGKVADGKRVAYIRDHLRAMRDSLDAGVELLGYQYWSLLDIMSSSDGFEKRYGLVYVDATTLERGKKESFGYYKKVIASNGKVLDDELPGD